MKLGKKQAKRALTEASSVLGVTPEAIVARAKADGVDLNDPDAAVAAGAQFGVRVTHALVELVVACRAIQKTRVSKKALLHFDQCVDLAEDVVANPFGQKMGTLQ